MHLGLPARAPPRSPARAPALFLAGDERCGRRESDLRLQRHLVIGSQLARRLLLYEGLGINMIYVLAFLLACFGLTRTHLVSVAQITLVIATMFSGFMGLYLPRVPSDSDFIVGSLDRLVFGFFLLAGPLVRGAQRT
jgi:hypothetical protein